MALHELTADKALYRTIFVRGLGPFIAAVLVATYTLNYRGDADYLAGLLSSILLILTWLVYGEVPKLFSLPLKRTTPPSEATKTYLWAAAFIVHTFATWKLGLDKGELTLLWNLLTVGALFEVFDRKKRTAIIIVSLVCLNLGFYVRGAETPLSCLYYELFFIGTIAVFLAGESWIERIFQTDFTEKAVLNKVLDEVDKLKRDAFTGSQLKTYLHEVNNALMVIAYLGSSLKKTDPGAANKVERAMAKLVDVKNLVLGHAGIGSTEDMKVTVSLKRFLSDLEEITLPMFQNNYTTKLKFENTVTSDELNRYHIQERMGASFYIIANLVKNSMEASSENTTQTAEVRVNVSIHEDNLRIVISDNGPGFPDSVLELLENGELVTTRIKGYGLGLKFVIRECEKSNIDIQFKSVKNVGATVTLNWTLLEYDNE